MTTFKVIILDRSPAIQEVDCENGCVFVSKSSLKKLKCNSKDWVKVWLKSDEYQYEERQRYSQLYAIDTITSEDIAYISPQLWFNLQNISSLEFKNRPLFQSNTNLMVCKEGVARHHLKFISCINVALIQSPDYSPTNDFSKILKKYFDRKRYVAKNDVIGISSREDPTYHSSNKDPTDSQWPVVYFRVSLIEGDGCLVDTNHSKLYQSGTVHSVIPASLPSYYEPPDCCSLETRPFIGLNSAVDALSDIMLPYLMPRNRVIGTVLVKGPPGSGKTSAVRSVCAKWNLNIYQINCNHMIGETLTQTETKIKTSLAKASLFAPVVVMISEINVLANNELYDESRMTAAFRQSLFDLIDTNTEWPIIVVATDSESKKFAENELSSLFIHSIEMDCLTDDEREQLLQDLIGQIAVNDIDFKELSQKTVGFYLGDIKALVSKAVGYLIENLDEESEDQMSSSFVLSKDHIMKALEDIQRLHSDGIGSANIPNVEWDDIGGHEDIKSEILDTIQLPLECPQLLSLGFKRSGILLHGPPGTGKTLLAKAAASQCSLNFLSVKGPELINMFVGQSEENVRNVFARARKCAPAVIFFDELDSLAPNRGNSGDSGGVMDRVVSQLLAEMDGINKANDVFIIGATNRPDLLDSALLRPGRFDRLLYVGIAEDSKSRLQILKALTRKFAFDSDVSLDLIESKCRSGLSGADFYAICVNALMNALQRYIRLLDNNSLSEEECEPIVQMNDFLSIL